ncbi:DUF1294 domain-containing protein [Amphibacillus xylanus]|uniref:DUF1294 domain-containing protein n=1 Tax=Amphibacillus xylanus (strain ATCC 51415 / DSM 6626 / JCM 7361 / LMG 17667 / NBRC 15112 / Ep01) TaxID=698758 RepID=K0IXA0_AMPXN|nr:DUF1294 domain-containing protein [Amphibacillus xylanus]BAM47085.1 hypothetical protein AXY_09530 [Amphibacillus xylanus NBRC 15112]
MKKIYMLLIIINLCSLIIMKVDKSRARNNQWRIPEMNIWLISLLGGSVGTYIGMKLFRHKTKHLSFKIGIPLLILIQALTLIML